jgi:pilus assembly protein CpaB
VRSSTIVMIVFAAVFGLLAVFLAQAWLNSQAEMRAKNLDALKKPLATQTVVVASKPLRFGAELGPTSLREVPWPQEAVPAGAFSKITDLTSSGRRVVLTAIEPNEPVLSVKITGPGERATLSALVTPGMKAVTIRINDVEGVGGFVLPGDHVDVALTRQYKDRDEKQDAETQVVLQDIRVLAIDQVADERVANPAVAKSATLEVDTVGAQKLGLAGSIGTLSLHLRKAGEANTEKSLRVSLKDLFTQLIPDRARAASVTITVRRGTGKGTESEGFSVPVEGDKDHAVAAAGDK